MLFARQLLAPGERVRSSGRPHWADLVFRLLRRALHLVVVFVVAEAIQSDLVYRLLNAPFLLQVLPEGEPLPIPYYVVRACGLVAVYIVASALLDALRWRLSEHVVTDQRVLQTAGVVVRTSLETPLDRIDDFYLAQSALGRALDYGDLAVLTGSQASGNLLRCAPDPLGLRRTILSAREARLGSGGDDGSAQARRQRGIRDVQGALKELAGMREHGLVSDDEFETKKRELMARL